MVVELKTKLVEVHYWDCGDLTHSHRTYRSARNCVAKRELAGRCYTRVCWTPEKREYVLTAYKSGVTCADLAVEFGVSVGNMMSLVTKLKAEKIRHPEREVFSGLNTRVKKVLRNLGIHTVDELRAAVKEGKLTGVPNLGEISKKQISKWLGRLDQISLHADVV